MTAAKRLRIARILTRSAIGRQDWHGYAPLGRPLTRRERARRGLYGSRAWRLLTLPVAVLRAPAELGER